MIKIIYFFNIFQWTLYYHHYWYKFIIKTYYFSSEKMLRIGVFLDFLNGQKEDQ